MPYFDAGGFWLHYLDLPQEAGVSTPALLLHALGSSGEDWVLQLTSLRKGRRLLAPDLRGHGRSEEPAGWPSIGQYAGDVASLLRAEVGAPVHLVGLSLGGAVGLEMALSHPQHVISLTLINSFPRLRIRPSSWSLALRRLIHLGLGDMEGLGRLVAGGLFPRAEQAWLRDLAADRLAANQSRAYLRALLAVARFDRRRALSQIQAPTLVLAGELDRTIPMEQKLELARSIPGARFEKIPGSGHATPMDAPEETNRLLRAFFAEVDQRLLAPAGVGPWAS